MQQLTTHQNEVIPAGTFNNEPLYIQVRDHVLNRIKLGEWKPEQNLPNESDLARLYRCSAGTMRKALDDLESQGYLTRRQGRGTFVNDKRANDQQRKLACIKKSLMVIKEAVEDAGQNTTPKLQSSLQTHIAEALFSAGYSGEGA